MERKGVKKKKNDNDEMFHGFLSCIVAQSGKGKEHTIFGKYRDPQLVC